MEEINKGISIIRVLKQVADAVKQGMESQFREMNLTGPQGMLMGILVHYGEMKVSDLSEKLGLSNSTVSGIIDRLENQGLIARTRSTEDRRVVYVDVTPEFRRNAKDHFHGIERRFQELMSKASPEELDKILEGLSTLKKVIDRQKE